MKGHPGPHDLCARFEGRSIPFQIRHALLQGRTLSLPRPPAVCWTRFGGVASGWGPSQGAPLPAPVCGGGRAWGSRVPVRSWPGSFLTLLPLDEGTTPVSACSHTLPWAGRAAREVPVPSSQLCSPPADGQGAHFPEPVSSSHGAGATAPAPRVTLTSQLGACHLVRRLAAHVGPRPLQPGAAVPRQRRICDGCAFGHEH